MAESVAKRQKGSISNRKPRASTIDQAMDIYGAKQSNGMSSSQVFLTEPPLMPNQGGQSKKFIGQLKNFDSVKTAKFPILSPTMKNFNSTGQFARNLIFPNIKKSTSLMNLRAQSSQAGKPKKKTLDMQKLKEMSQSKHNPKQVMDLTKEKGELAVEINNRNQEACKFIRTMYQGEDQTMINEYVASIESLQVVKDKIDQFKRQLQEKIKDYNELQTDTKHFLQQLEEQKKQQDLLKKNSEVAVSDSEKLIKLRQENKEVEHDVDMELLYSEQMNHMIERDKKQIICFKMPIQEKKDDIAKLINSIKSVRELKGIMLSEISRYQNAESTTNNGQDNKKKIKENLKEMYVQDICQYAIFDEVYKNQMKIIEDKEAKIRKKKADEKEHRNQTIKEKEKEEEKKISEANDKIQDYDQDFLKLQRQCNVKEIPDLINYHQDLVLHKKELSNIQDMMQIEIEEQKLKLKEKKQQLVMLKYLAQDTSKDSLAQTPKPQHEEQNLVKLSKVELDYNQVENEKMKDEIMKRKKRAKEVIASAIMSVARVACQLKEESKITPQNVDQKLSVCGLRLEHMVATLYKKKPTFNIESVNTDYSSDLPPFFLGIKYAIYVNPPTIEEDNQNDLERLLQMSQAKPDQTPDEENDFVKDQYTKQKRINKALKSTSNLEDNDKKNGGGNTGSGQGANSGDKTSKSQQKASIMNLIKQRPETQGSNQGTGSTITGTGNEVATQGGKQEKDNYDQVFQVLSGGKDRGKNKTASQQVVILTEKEKEEMRTKEKIQKQLMKIVHKTWYIYDPDKKQKAIANANPFKSKNSPSKKDKERDQQLY